MSDWNWNQYAMSDGVLVIEERIDYYQRQIKCYGYTEGDDKYEDFQEKINRLIYCRETLSNLISIEEIVSRETDTDTDIKVLGSDTHATVLLHTPKKDKE